MDQRTTISILQKKNRWLAFLLLAAILACMNIGVIVSEDLAQQDEVEIAYYVVNEFSGVFLAFALLPFLFWFFRAYPLRPENWWRHLPLYLLASVIFGAAHTILMYVVRTLLYQWLGLGSYPEFYGLLEYRFLMEYFKQLLFFIVTLGGVELYRKWKENEEQKWRASQLERQLVQARLQALQMQLNPHFLFNTLNLISAVMYESPKRADKMIDNLSRLLRLTLNSQGMEMHALAEEVEWLELYLQIMQARFEDRLKVQLDITGEAGEAQVPVFILQPIVENAIKFSVSRPGPAEVIVRGRREKGMLEMAVLDNGPGPGTATDSEGNGLGLANTSERLERLFGEGYAFSVKDRPVGGAEVRICIPLRIVQKASAII
ncbi:MAG: histidine kinase [Lewinellaceae bacterium]|nr:histidine kinase [Phaeodactylibacter sp.]MCB9038151.1 histidine kinase [Lewinellaceae bacterium]